VLFRSPPSSLLLAAGFGFGWGLGSACFGLAVKRVGMGLAFSLVAGLTGALGSLIPWFSTPSPAPLYSRLLWAGVIVMLGGVAVCAWAGHQREQVRNAGTPVNAHGSQFLVGLGIAIAGGILSCLMNLGFVYGAAVTRQAETLGAAPLHAPNLLWLVVMSFGFLANALYCGWLLWHRQSWRCFRAPESGLAVLLALGMAAIWEGNLVAYAAGASKIGSLGPSVGWATVLSVTVITSNLWGAAAGEWRGAGRRACMTMLVGVGLLVAAVAVLGWASATI
jgi:L-rhamnose-H+ transport protein